jgi:hypothetical protein
MGHTKYLAYKYEFSLQNGLHAGIHEKYKGILALTDGKLRQLTRCDLNVSDAFPGRELFVCLLGPPVQGCL